MSNFTSFVDRVVGATYKAPRLGSDGRLRASWSTAAETIFGALTEFVLSTLVFLTVAGVLVSIGNYGGFR